MFLASVSLPQNSWLLYATAKMLGQRRLVESLCYACPLDCSASYFFENEMICFQMSKLKTVYCNKK